MRRTPKGDKMNLEMHACKWRVTLSVPLHLQKAMGATTLKRSLGTGSLSLANVLKWGGNKDLKDVIKSFRVTGSGPSRGDRAVLMREATEIAKALASHPVERHVDALRDVVDVHMTRFLDASVGHHILTEGDEVEAEEVGMSIPSYDPTQQCLVDEFLAVALHGSVPIGHADTDYKKVRLKVSPRTKDDHCRALRLLTEFCIVTGGGDAVSDVGENAVTDFVADLENAKGFAPGTIKNVSAA